MKRIMYSILMMLFITFIWWYGGADFSERNPMNAYLLFIAIALGAAVYTLPSWRG